MPTNRIVDLDLKPKHAREVCISALNKTYGLVAWYINEQSYTNISGTCRWHLVGTVFRFDIEFWILKGGIVSLRLTADTVMPGPLESLENSILGQQEKFFESYHQKTPDEQKAIDRGAYDGVVFMSYARRDFKFADKLRKDLYLCDLEVWLDQDYLRTSQKWPVEIESAIEKTNVLVLVIAPDGIASKWIENELSHAIKHEKPIFPVIHSETAMPKWLDTYVGEIETADLTKAKYRPGFDELLEGIKTQIGPAGSANSPEG